jgi:hypothetical protein
MRGVVIEQKNEKKEQKQGENTAHSIQYVCFTVKLVA